MKQLKKFVVLGVLLLIGINCVAQGEYQKDSIWGLEWNLEGSKLEVSLLSSYDDFFVFEISSYEQGRYNYLTRYDYGLYSTEIGIVEGNEESMYIDSIKIDTLNTGIYKITVILSLSEQYLNVPEDLSTYRGYFGVRMLSENSAVMDDYRRNELDYTLCNQFFYFDLIGRLSFIEDYRFSNELHTESYYSLLGIPTSVKNTKEPLVVVVKDGEGKIVERSVRIIRK